MSKTQQTNDKKNYDHIKASFFMPVYNSGNFLDDSIQSILNQTHLNFELIIIDDGSTDNSLSIIKKYAAEEKRILFRTRNHKGIPITRNEGIEIASGKYLLPMDSDDICFAERLSKQIAFMEKNTDIVASGANMVSRKNKRRRKHTHPLDHEAIRIKLLFGSAINNPCSIIRLSILKKYNIRYLETDLFAQDYRLWVALSKIGKLANLNKTLVYYRDHPNQVQKTNRLKQYLIGKSITSSQLFEFGLSLTQDEIDMLLIENNKDVFPIDKSETYIMEKTYSLFKKILLQNNLKNSFDQKKLLHFIYKKYENVCLMFNKDGFNYFKKNKLTNSYLFHGKYLVHILFCILYRKVKRINF